ncbi:MAG TPA: META domain-containing protein [Thermoanaerobaculia bacterium]|nr:META domain-containing protein [Thermoanaerobaculia bacterium]
MRRTMLTISLVLTFLGCISTASVEELRGREWMLTWVEGFAAMPAGVQTPTIRFGTDGRLSGNTGCNSAGAAYRAEGDRLTIDALISTKRACVAAEGNALESAYVRAVEATKRFRITSGELELLSESGSVLARFR